MMAMKPLRVGDVVRVSQAVLGNLEGALAVVVEVYPKPEPGSAPHADDRSVLLLFPNGQAREFSSAELAVCGVARIGHRPTLAAYQWRSIVHLLDDYRRGVFAEVWSRAWL